MTGKIPELLAPAGGPEALRAAVAAGADAVYLGGRSYGARHYAGNFSPEEMEEAVGYAHLRKVKVYATVNTVIKDRELPGVMEYLLFLYSIGVDAVLVQDFGLSALARAMIPCLHLHASTQMTVHNLAGARYVESLGFERIVLARELTGGEVSRISRGLENAGTEIFIHGALCFGYSGNCLLSAMIGGRSGNRGMCAQPCRKNYRLTEVKKDRYGRMQQGKVLSSGYLMSMKDLCMYDVLGEVKGAPVDSLKIEGRMKSPEYVAVVTDVYRRALDALFREEFVPSAEDRGMMALAFNREFTPGYFHGCRHEDVISRDRPGNRGLYIGIVTGYDKQAGMVEVLPKNNFIPAKGDGLLFLSPGFEEGMIIRQEPVKMGRKIGIRTDMKLPSGSSIYITRSRYVPDRAKEIILRGERDRKIPVILTFGVRDDGAAILGGYFRLPEGKTVYFELVSGFRMEMAINRPLKSDQVKDQLMKAGGTVFEVTGIKLDMPQNLFTPISGLNGLRRKFFEMAEKEIIRSKRPGSGDINPARERVSVFRSSIKEGRGQRSRGGITGLSCYVDSIEMVEAALRGGADTIYYEITSIDAPDPEELLEILGCADSICDGASARLYWKLPDIIRQDLLDRVLIIAGNLPSGMGIMTGDAGASHAIKMKNPNLETAGSHYLNVCNHFSVKTLSGVFERLTLSPELSFGDIRDMGGYLSTENTPALELLVQGNIEVMISENSLACGVFASCTGNSRHFFGLLDESQRLFPVSIDSSCRSHIRNADELCLFDYLPEILSVGPISVAVDARSRSPQYAEEMLYLYRKGIEAVSKESRSKPDDIANLKESVRKISNKRITSGFFRKE